MRQHESRPTKRDTAPAADAVGGGVLCAALVVLLALYVAETFLGRVDGGPRDEGTWLYNLILLGGAAGCAARGLVGNQERAPWLLLGLAMGLWTCGDLYYTFFLSTLDSVPFPSIADAFYLSFYPVGYVGLGLLLRRRIAHFHGSLWLDGAIGALAMSAIGAAVVYDVVLQTTGGPALVVATNLAYPLFDLLMLAMLVGVLALTGWRLDRTWVLIAAGFASFTIADAAYLYESAAGTYVEGGMVDIGWAAAAVLLACAAWQPARRLVEARDEGWQTVAIPAVFAFIGLSLLVYDHFHRLNPLALALSSAALAAVIVRTAYSFREKLRLLQLSRREALTDSLTGLPNRRSFMADVEQELAQADVRHPLLLVLFDLDGFKTYNDTYGHPAGDALLMRLSANLAAVLERKGRAYRMGGDEFCIIASAAHVGPGSLLSQASQALSEDGEGFSVTCSYGSVLLPEEADRISDALRIADGRMYVHKNRHRPSAGRQSMDVLLRALHERDSSLGRHLSGVAELAELLGRRLRVPEEQLEVLRQAAELHDVGKVAIPEEILTKPGPLNEDEWEFVRRHTLIGERILGAAPALGQVAQLVRSTHEHFDGTGYPDGLAGEDIPLGARIIAVCDAYDAMTSERPYAKTLTEEQALRQILRGAGKQFDPVVVEAFIVLRSQLSEDAQLVA